MGSFTPWLISLSGCFTAPDLEVGGAYGTLTGGQVDEHEDISFLECRLESSQEQDDPKNV
jgi:hypothetical protein